jgi:predicted nucleic acid-binding protein
MIVVDACVLANALADDNGAGRKARDRLAGQELAAPDLLMVETASVLRGLWLSGQIDEARFSDALDGLDDLAIDIVPTRVLLRRTFELRHNTTSYDACYIALAETLGCPLVTADARMAQATGATCRFEVLSDTD